MATHLRAYGIEVVVVGGSAITLHVPNVYTSMDVDFAVTSGMDRHRIRVALGKLGFQGHGRIFVHPDANYSLDFVADRPYIDQEPVYDFAEIPTSVGNVRVLHLEDAIADRIAAILHWSDSESLDVAERAAAAARDRLTWARVDAALQKLNTKSPETLQRMALARKRLCRALTES
ncbi:MAG TPA: hypothetical protein VKV57_01815 [bacterium]|nr:hypothetical protein [bacterium]